MVKGTFGYVTLVIASFYHKNNLIVRVCEAIQYYTVFATCQSGEMSSANQQKKIFFACENNH